ncbi:DUF5522 domain-containing protein [Rapidithrix thailandica]|uniref:DUF5522 domain-containing protein n=1 Tax=Rapidithrix thailandica TaxID=413964 RepID=A0AAW9S842_9BACT
MSVKQKKCPDCGTDFTCGCDSAQACWCDSLPAIMPLSTDKGCTCPECLKSEIKKRVEEFTANPPYDETQLKRIRERFTPKKLNEGIDYYLNGQGYWVFTKWYHLSRGYCCENGCKHCPYGFKKF